jgi:negative regulator of flagellin synthesis FlgM
MQKMINKIQPNPPASYTNGVQCAEGKLEVAQIKAQEDTVQVSLSEDALVLRRMMQAVKDTPDVRVDMVEAIRAQLEAGTYQVNATGLAEKLLPLLR